MENPFKPTAGKMPPILIGRESIVNDFTDGLENGAGAPGRLMVITGQRGFGKTVLLTQLGKEAQKRGWTVVSETASERLTERIVNALDQKAPRIAEAELSPALSIPGVLDARLGTARVAIPPADPLSLRAAIERRFKKIKDGKGVLVTVDETQAASRDDLVAIATAVQHVIRDEDMRDVPDSKKKGIALVFAGLPSIIDDVLNDDVLTFLRRSVQRSLDAIPVPDIRDAYVSSVRESGKDIALDVALDAATRTQGYPYLIQLVGYYMWQRAHRRKSSEIEREDVEKGSEDALLAFGDAVCAPIMRGLGVRDQEYLKAMAASQQGDGPVRASEVVKKMGVSASTASKYRKRLVSARVIYEAGYGYVAFSTPYFGRYLRARG